MGVAFIGEIKMFGGNFAPRAWAFCEGQLMSIAQNQALFSIIGTTYGGDGRTTFGLPDMRGRMPIHSGTGPGLPTYRLGDRSGAASYKLTVAQLPAHDHAAAVSAAYFNNNIQTTVNSTVESHCYDAAGTSTTPVDCMPAKTGIGDKEYTNAGTLANMQADQVTITNMVQTQLNKDSPVEVKKTGSYESVNNMPPYQVVNYIICLQGVFPSRS